MRTGPGVSKACLSTEVIWFGDWIMKPRAPNAHLGSEQLHSACRQRLHPALSRQCVHTARCGGSDRPPRPSSPRRGTTKERENTTAGCSTSLLLEQSLHGAFRAGSRPIPSSFSRMTYMHRGRRKIAGSLVSLGADAGMRF